MLKIIPQNFNPVWTHLVLG